MNRDTMFKTEKLDSFPPNSNPFSHDSFRMGTEVSRDIMAMYPKQDNSPYIILVHIPTGKRIKITMPEAS